MSMWQRTVDYFKGAKEELLKVSWPTRKETLYLTIIVIISVLAAILVFGTIDYLLQQIVKHFVG